MNHSATLLALIACTFVCQSPICQSTSAEWTRFRGPNGSGISEAAVPVEFGADKNMKWKVELPGRGVSCPIIVGDKIFVTCFSGYGGDLGDDIEQLKRHLVCVDRATGKIVWDKAIKAEMPEDRWTGMGVPAHGYASHTPTSDGTHVFAFFGKSGVVAFDMDGNQKWKTNVGKESNDREWGSSSSPILHKDMVIVTASDESEALIALDKSTGEEKWRQEAEMLDGIWGTPALAEGPKGPEVVLAVPGEIWGFNADTGKLRWFSQGNEGASHSIVVVDDVAYSIGGGRGGSNGVAVKVGGSKEVTDLVWENKASGRFATPLVYNGRVYSISGGIAACYDAETGDKIFADACLEPLVVIVGEVGPEVMVHGVKVHQAAARMPKAVAQGAEVVVVLAADAAVVEVVAPNTHHQLSQVARFTSQQRRGKSMCLRHLTSSKYLRRMISHSIAAGSARHPRPAMVNS